MTPEEKLHFAIVDYLKLQYPNVYVIKIGRAHV